MKLLQKQQKQKETYIRKPKKKINENGTRQTR